MDFWRLCHIVLIFFYKKCNGIQKKVGSITRLDVMQP